MRERGRGEGRKNELMAVVEKRRGEGRRGNVILRETKKKKNEKGIMGEGMAKKIFFVDVKNRYCLETHLFLFFLLCRFAVVLLFNKKTLNNCVFVPNCCLKSI